MLQASELTLDSGAATVEVAEPLTVPWDAREQPAAEGNRHDGLIAFAPRSGMTGSQSRSSHSA